MGLRTSRLGLIAAAVVVMACPATAGATCYSSTPANQSFADSPADGESGLAPEITSADFQLNGACTVTAGPTLANRPSGLIDGDFVAVYLDVDGNPSTGSPTFGGADRAIATLGQTGDDSPPLMGTWDPVQNKFNFTGGPTLTASGAGGFTAPVDTIGLAQNVTAGIAIGTSWQGTFDTYFDFAPDAGAPDKAFRLATAYSTAAPPPPAAAPAQPTHSAASTAPSSSTTSASTKAAKQCLVPSVRNKTLAAARKALSRADCIAGKLKVVHTSKYRTGRVVRTSPAAKRVATSAVTIYISKRTAKKKHHAKASAMAAAAAAQARNR
jgi:hypothetical protein